MKTCGPPRKDLVGQTFGKLLVLEATDYHAKGYSGWRCRCECGNETIVRTGLLVAKQTKSCGCLKAGHGRNAADAGPMIGRRFVRLVAVEQIEPVVHRPTGQGHFWRCQCDCGGSIIARGKDLRYGNTKSCGCLRGRPRGS